MSASLFIYPFSVHKLEKFHGALAKQIRQSKKPTQFPIYINFQLDSVRVQIPNGAERFFNFA